MHSGGNTEKTFLDKILEGIVGSALIIMTIVIFFQIIARYVLNASLAWSEELARSLQIWMVFMGAALAVGRASYIGMTDLLEKFPPTMFKVFQLFGDLIIIGFSLFCTDEGFIMSAAEQKILFGSLYSKQVLLVFKPQEIIVF